MATYRLTVEYEGTRYRGWQQQRNARSVSGELRRAVEEAGVRVLDLGGAGRTDAGVHALAQTAHLRLARPVEAAGLREAVNDRLPPDIHVLSLLPAPEKFHARHDAVLRSYLYQISLRRTAFAKRFVWWVRRPLDADRVSGAARLIEGRHDFSLFCERPAAQDSTLVVVESVQVARFEPLLLIRFVASHFLWKMVRRLTGALVRVGSGELERDRFAELLDGQAVPGRLPSPAAWTAPPSGLFLERVLYAGDPPLARPAPAHAIGPEEPAGRRGRADSP